MKKKAYKIGLIAFTVVLVIIIFYPTFTETKKVKVTEIIDGDTVKIRWEEETKTVRLKKIDTPETQGYNTPGEFEGVPKNNWKCLQKWGYKAKEFVDSKLYGQKVRLKYHRSIFSVERGRYGRILGEIEMDEQNKTLGKFMVKNGFARSYEEAYGTLEARARNNSIGLWECQE